MKRLSIGKCYSQAWSSFAGWWIPICMLSLGIFVFNLAPRYLVSDEMNQWLGRAAELMGSVASSDLGEIERSSEAFDGATSTLTSKLVKYSLLFLPAVALLTVLLLMVANWAVRDEREDGQSIVHLAYVTGVHVALFLAVVVGWSMLFVPGVYLYVRLFFVPLLMLDQKLGARAAMWASFAMSRGNFWRLLGLIMINLAIQGVSMMTVIGVIPATGFVNTVRASAYQSLKG